MGVKDWIFGGKDEDPSPLTIQQLEQLLIKRRGKHTQSITLLVGDVSYAVMKQTDHDRLIRIADALEDLVKTLSKEDK